MKARVKGFEGSGILVTQAKVSQQTTGLAAQFLKIKDQYECLVKLIKIMESVKYTIKEAVQTIKELDLGEDTTNFNRFIQKRMQNNNISKVMNIKRPDIGCLQFTSTFSAHNCFCRKKFFSSRTEN